MPTFQRCPEDVDDLVRSVLRKHESHAPLLANKVRIDMVFAFADVDENTNERTGPALTLHGHAALGIAKKISLKERALGRGDAEISLDGDWWGEANEREKEALLDHELHHIQVKEDDRGAVLDDLKRPVIRLRKHDFEFGWFNVVAARNGTFSLERQQAKRMWEKCGQLYWPELSDVSGHTDSAEVSARALRTA